jgi:hypothetical protein
VPKRPLPPTIATIPAPKEEFDPFKAPVLEEEIPPAPPDPTVIVYGVETVTG